MHGSVPEKKYEVLAQNPNVSQGNEPVSFMFFSTGLV